MAPHSIFLFTLLTFSLTLHEISAAAPAPAKKFKYNVINEAPKHPGGIKFEKILGGVPGTQKLAEKIHHYIWYTLFLQKDPADQKPLDEMFIYIKDFKGAEAVAWGNNKINVSAVYLDGYQGNLTWEYTSLLHHEITHVFQWNGEGSCPMSVVEGVADFTILKANYYPPLAAQPGSGNKWDQGYDYTAPFFKYIEGFVPDYVAKFNKMIRYKYNVSYFKTLTGKPVEQLWKEYKAKYGQKV